MNFVVFLVAVLAVAMISPERERRSVLDLGLGLGLGHDGAVLLGNGGWGCGPAGAVVAGPVVPPVAVLGPHSGSTAAVGPSVGSAIVAGPSGTIVAPSHGLAVLGLRHSGLVAGHNFW